MSHPLANDPLLTVVSKNFPPQVSGSAILLNNLLSNYKGRINAIVGYHRYAKADGGFRPPCPTQYLSFPRTLPRVYENLKRRMPMVVCRILRNSIRRAFTTLGTNVVLTAFPYDDLVVASFLAARDLRLPFYVHMHDLWKENVPSGSIAARFAERWEPLILKEATRVLCMTEAMQEYYAKDGIETHLLPHCVSDQDYLTAPTTIRPPLMSKPTVLFVGSVSPHMNLDALKVLATASELLPPEYELLYCTAPDITALHRLGISSRRLRTMYVSRAEVQRLQSEAHVLIAPLSHKNCSINEVRTVFSTKLLEYLVAGRPIIVFAPEGSFHVASARKNGWGYVVTEDSPGALASAIVKVVTDEQLAAALVHSAYREAKARKATCHAGQLREWVFQDARQSACLAGRRMVKKVEVAS